MSTTKQFIHSINPQQNITQLTQEILNKDEIFFTFDFKFPINEENDKKISINDFWKLAKIKAKKVSLFVDEILSCDVIETAPMGFIRKITMASGDVTQGKNSTIVHIKERVVIDDETKTLLFFQLKTTGKVLLFAINHVTEEINNVYFSGHYVYSIPTSSKEKADQDFITGSNKVLPSRMKHMVAKMKALAKSEKFAEIYQQLYG
jgi:hypothetical protein